MTTAPLTTPVHTAPATASRQRAPAIVAGVAFAVYAVWSICLHRLYFRTGYDLGIFEQAVRSYAEGHWPVSDVKAPGFPLLGDHFHPIIAVLAPLYRLWPRPDTLLLAQAALFAISAVPVTRCAIRALGTRRGTTLGVGYVFSCGLLSAVTFDFHEIAFAVPLLAFSIERLLRREWGAAVAFAAPLALVKEDLPMTVAAIGLYLVWRGQRRLGWITAISGVLTSVLLAKVVVPLINVQGQYAFAGRLAAPDPFDGVWLKLATLLLVLGPTLFTGLYSPLSILLLPTLAWRFLSSYPFYWGPGYHYSAVLMPIAFLAAVDGLERVGGWRRTAAPVCSAVAALGVVAALLPGLPPPRAQRTAMQEALARIPDGATVAASSQFVPRLTSRCRVYYFPDQPNGTDPDWIVVTTPIPVSVQERHLTELQHTSYFTVTRTNSVLLLRHR